MDETTETEVFTGAADDAAPPDGTSPITSLDVPSGKPEEEVVANEEGSADEADPAAAGPSPNDVAAAANALADRDPALQTAFQMLVDAKVSNEQLAAVFGTALSEGDPSKIDQTVLQQLVGAGKAALVMGAVQNFYAVSQAQTAEMIKTVHETVGGAENWQKMVEWANAEMAPADRKAIIDLIGQGGLQAKLGAQHLASLFSNASGTTVVNNPAASLFHTTAPAAPAQPTIKPIDAKEFSAAYQKAMNEGDHAAANAIIERRRATIARGRG